MVTPKHVFDVQPLRAPRNWLTSDHAYVIQSPGSVLSVLPVNKLNSEIGMVAVVRAIAASMGLPKPAAASRVGAALPLAEDALA